MRNMVEGAAALRKGPPETPRPSTALRAVPLPPVPLRSTEEDINHRAAKKAFI